MQRVEVLLVRKYGFVLFCFILFISLIFLNSIFGFSCKGKKMSISNTKMWIYLLRLSFAF